MFLFISITTWKNGNVAHTPTIELGRFFSTAISASKQAGVFHHKLLDFIDIELLVIVASPCKQGPDQTTHVLSMYWQKWL